MEERIITFTANEQGLVKTGGISHYASDTISYIKAVFTLGENWQGFDEVRAVFKSPYECRPAVLDSNGECYVPVEVLFYKGKVKVNLVGSIVTETEVTDRLTTYSVEALDVDEDVPICGEESQPISPSEYEQFVAKVANDANRAEQSATDAKTYADEAEASAQNASESASASAVSASDSARSATASEGYAQNASEIAVEVEVMKNEVELAKDKVLSMRATAETLEAGSDATASYSDGLLTLGIPRGDRGEQGIQGETGATPNLTIGTVETLAPTEDATATITGTTENPVLNLGLPKGDTGEVSLEDLEALLPTDTASGDIVTIPDGQSVIPAESLKVELEPIQDLHGYDKPWSGGAGKNLLNVGGRVNQTSAEVKYTSDDNYIILNGTKNGGGYATMGNLTLTLPAGTYYAKAFIISGTTTNEISLYVNNGTSDITGTLLGTEKSFTLESETTLRFRFAVWNDGTVLTNYTVGIVVSKTSGIDKFYPYSNICPISGHTEVNTHRTGKNLFNPNSTDNEWVNTVGELTHGSTTGKSVRVKVSGVSSLVASMSNEASATNILLIATFASDMTLLSRNVITSGKTLTRTIPSNAVMAIVSCYAYDLSGNVQLEAGLTATAYEPYQGTTYTTTLGRTVYGGTLDVVSGEVVVDRAMVDLGSLTWTYASTPQQFRAGLPQPPKSYTATETPNAICSQYIAHSHTGLSNGQMSIYYASVNGVNIMDSSYTDATAFKTAMGGVQLCYELATPQTYQLTPQEVRLLLGTNNIWSDGNVTLVYSADIQKWVEKKLNGNSTTLTMSRPMTAELNETETAEETEEAETADAEAETETTETEETE